MDTTVTVYILRVQIDNLKIRGWYYDEKRATAAFNKYKVELENGELEQSACAEVYIANVPVDIEAGIIEINKTVNSFVQQAFDSGFEFQHPVLFASRVSSVEGIVDDIKGKANVDVFYNEDRSQAVIVSTDRDVVKIVEKDLVRTSTGNVWTVARNPIGTHRY